MVQAYARNGYRFNPTPLTLANDFTVRTSLQVGPDEFSTVEEIDVEEGEGVRVGQGTSANPLQAEGSIRGDIQDNGGADIDGKYRLVVLNTQNNVKDIVKQGSIDEIEQTRANSLDGDITPVSGKPEIYEPNKLGFQLKTDSGTATYSRSNSSLTIDGYLGEKLR
jgi:hypothetical protein